MINHGQKAIVMSKRDARKSEWTNRLSNHKDRDAGDLEVKYSQATSMHQYLKKENEKRNGS
jgi:hypothetical protein